MTKFHLHQKGTKPAQRHPRQQNQAALPQDTTRRPRQDDLETTFEDPRGDLRGRQAKHPKATSDANLRGLPAKELTPLGYAAADIPEDNLFPQTDPKHQDPSSCPLTCRSSWGPQLYQLASQGAWAQQVKELWGLFLIPTPIGHLEDLSLRSLVTLGAMNGLLCEDTRQTRLLLTHYGIQAPCYAYHAHNEHTKLAGILARLRQRARLGLVSDRGTPLLSDPGFPLVRACLNEGIPVHGLPGPSSPLMALTLSGLPCTPFFFQGFLPLRRRQKTIQALGDLGATLVLFESPHRLTTTLGELADCWGPRQACLLRELTKKFQQRVPGTLNELQTWAKAAPHIGECVLVVAGKE